MLTCGLALANNVTDPDSERKVELLPGGERGFYKLLYVSNGIHRVHIKILNDNGRLVWERSVTARPSFMLPMDLSQKRPGRYQVEISDHYGTVQRNVFISNRLNTTVFPCTQTNLYRIVVRNGDWEQQLKVEILDLAGGLKFKESVSFSGGISKMYDLTELATAPFRFHLCNGQNICDWFYFPSK